MNTIIKPFLSIIFLISLAAAVPVKSAAQASISLQVFYDELSPYGEWVDNPEYGYVWIPDVPQDFAPYSSNGYWVFTDAGWTWLSTYNWGWAPFHYGRWYYDPYYGYAWVPGNEWGPGWVTWRSSRGYYGWAPIGPGISIDFAYSSGYNQPYNQWRFVRDRDFGRSNIYNYYVTNNYYTTIINNSVVINNMYEDRPANVRYNTGPERTDVQRHTGNRINPVSLRGADKPSQSLGKNEYKLYRPGVEKTNNEARRPAPQRVANWNNGKPEIQKERAIRKQEVNQRDKQRPVVVPRKEQPKRDEPVQPVRKTQPVREQPVRQPQRETPVKQPKVQPPRNEQPVREQPVRQPRKEEPVKQQPRKEQPVQQPRREQPVQQPRKEQPVREQPARPQPVKQQPAPRKEQSPGTQPVRKDQQEKQQPVRKDKPVKQERTVREFNDRPDTQWPVLPEAALPPVKRNKGKAPFLQPLPFTPSNNPVNTNRKASAMMRPLSNIV
jgi:hypothetical protein